MVALAAFAISACAPEPLPYEAVVDVKQLMLGVIEPSAEVYWDAVGTIIDLEGTTEIAPSSDEEWEAVRNAAMVVAESGNLLLTPERIRAEGNWVETAKAMIAAGRQALAAAEARDTAAVFDAGGELYLVCSECHAAFAPDTLRPNFER